MLTSTAVKKYLAKIEVKAKGHMNQQFQNLRSTKRTTKIEAVTEHVTPAIVTEYHYYTVEESGRTFSDQIGRYSHTFSKGDKYILIWYHYDINAIITERMKNRTEGEINKAFQKIHEKLIKQGYRPKVHRKDN